jgi:histidine triad (HIT) family protein
MEDCIFCKISRKEIPADIVYEDKDVIAFVDINPFTTGHIMVVPKKHSRWLWDMDNKDYLLLMERTKFLAKKLQKAFATEWIEEIVAGMGVHHTHIHLLPRIAGEKIEEEIPSHALIPKPSEKVMEEWAEKIKKVMK